MLLPDPPEKNPETSELARVRKNGDRSANYAEYARRRMQDQQQQADAINRRMLGQQKRRTA